MSDAGPVSQSDDDLARLRRLVTRPGQGFGLLIVLLEDAGQRRALASQLEQAAKEAGQHAVTCRASALPRTENLLHGLADAAAQLKSPGGVVLVPDLDALLTGRGLDAPLVKLNRSRDLLPARVPARVVFLLSSVAWHALVTEAPDLSRVALGVYRVSMPGVAGPEIPVGLLPQGLEIHLETRERATLISEREILPRLVAEATEPTLGTAESLLRLTTIDLQLGDLENAAKESEDGAAIMARVLGTTERREYADALATNAAVLLARRDLPRAQQRIEEALRIHERISGTSDHLDYAFAVRVLAGILSLQDDLEGARARLEQSLGIFERVPGATERRDYADTVQRLAAILRDQGDLEGARARLEQTLGIYARVLGTTEDRGYAECLLDLARVLRAQGDLRGAREKSEQALGIFERVLGTTEHPRYAAALLELARVIRSQGDLEGARERLERMLELQSRLDPTRDGLETAFTEFELAMTMIEQGRPEDRPQFPVLLTHALSVFRSQLGPEHPLTRDLASLLTPPAATPPPP